MGTITTKYSVGDNVWAATNQHVDVWTVCPDCKGELKWMIIFADGRQEECPCQTCQRGWEGPIGKVNHWEYQPHVSLLTVGQVRFYEDSPSYMCEETGIGSGTLHPETRLFPTREEAEAEAQNIYLKQMAHVASQNFKKKGEFANFVSTFGFCRAESLRKERALRKWLELIKPTESQ